MEKLYFFIACKILKRKEIEIDTEKCVRCGKCIKVCHHNAITKTSENRYVINNEGCARCYHCKEKCPKQAVVEKKTN